jgi:hypothetical protein
MIWHKTRKRVLESKDAFRPRRARMKSILVLLAFVISYHSFAKSNTELNFRNPVKLQKVSMKNTLPQNLVNLYKELNLEKTGTLVKE